jgi:hypothetical protein
MPAVIRKKIYKVRSLSAGMPAEKTTFYQVILDGKIKLETPSKKRAESLRNHYNTKGK